MVKVIDDIKGKKVLVAPLDWGLGHAARSVPVVRRLCTQNQVLIVCGASAFGFLKRELPELEIIKIDDWRIRYPKRKINFFTILSWIPVMLRNSVHEHRFVKRILRERGIQCIVSDNRYGLLYRDLECYIITHQVCPKMPKGFGFLENLGGWFFQKYLSKFRKVLIPDFEAGNNLSGSLAASRNLPPEKFVRMGILSRFNGQTAAPANCESSILVLMSGQENQRTVLENRLIEALAGIEKKILFVRGVGEGRTALADTCNIKFVNMLSGNDLRDALVSTSLIICRAGYSTLCDVVALGKQAVVIPTPGQTEQEYLAERLDGKFGFRSINQEDKQFAETLRNLL
ncbi:MAG: hypothetical protein K6F33_09375 [Bacteroidales bacterium]|nr:hypothetical protein [Bacteroidales bacterium]